MDTVLTIISGMLLWLGCIVICIVPACWALANIQLMNERKRSNKN